MEEDPKIQKIKDLMEFIGNGFISKKEFEDAFLQIMELVVKREEMVSKAVEMMQKTFDTALGKVQGNHTENYSSLRGQVNDLFVGDQLKRMDNETKSSVKKLEETVSSLIEKKLKDVDRKLSELDTNDKTSKKNLDGLGKAVSANLELKMKEMDVHKSLKDEVIEELKKEMERIKGTLANIPRGRAMGRAKSQITRRVDLTSQVNGTARAFTLPPDTLAVLGVQGSQFPFTMADVDFTLAGNVMTLGDQVATPAAGQTLVVLLDVLFYP